MNAPCTPTRLKCRNEWLGPAVASCNSHGLPFYPVDGATLRYELLLVIGNAPYRAGVWIRALRSVRLWVSVLRSYHRRIMT